MVRGRERRRCGEVRELLSEYIDRTLSHDKRSVVEEHLEACEACSGELESLQMTVQVLHRVPEAQVPRSFAITRVEERRATAFEPRGLGWLRPATALAAFEPRGLRWLRFATALAVVVLMVLVSVDFLVVGGGELAGEPPTQPASVLGSEEETDQAKATGGMFGSVTPVPRAGDEEDLTEGADTEAGDLAAPLGGGEPIPGAGGDGWPLLRQIEIAMGVVLFALMVTVVFTRRRRGMEVSKVE